MADGPDSADADANFKGSDADANFKGFKDEDIEDIAGNTSDDPDESIVVKKWTDLETRKLIKLYEENDLLWNVSSPDYRNRPKKHETLRMISNKLKIHVSEVQRKLHNLRSQVNSELKKLKRRSSGHKIYRSNWPYFTALKFIHAKPASSCMIMAPSRDEIKRSNSDSMLEIEFEDEATNHFSSFVYDQGDLHPAKKKKAETSEEIPPYVKQAMSVLNQTSDNEQIFGDFCASEMRQMKNPANKRIFKKIVMEAIANIGEAEAMDETYKPEESRYSYHDMSGSVV